MSKWKVSSEKADKSFDESILLDEVSKILFDPLNPMAVFWINWMFGEKYEAGKIRVEHGKAEYFDEKFNLTRSDLSFIVSDLLTGKRTKYHVEVQTEKDGSMVFRMFSYGMQIAFDSEPSADGIIDMPKQRVIYLEENSNIGDMLQQKFRYEDGTILDYRVPVIRNWRLNVEEIQREQIYPFLALQLNNYRKELKSAKMKKDTLEMARLSKVLAEESERLAKITNDLYHSYRLTDKDFTAVMNGIMYMTGHLNRVYLKDKKLEEGVHKMTKIYFDENVRQEGMQIGLEKGIESSIAIMLDVGVPKDKAVEQLQQKYSLELQQAQEYITKYYH